MSEIRKVWAREILDSRGTPTLEVDVTLSSGHVSRAAVPSGASTGAHEALELRDKDPKRYRGKGVLKAVENVNQILAPLLAGKKLSSWEEMDQLILKQDGTASKSKLGANAILGVSLALAKAAAMDQGEELFRFLNKTKTPKLPVPLMNVLNGGAHANNGLDVQEFMLVPQGFDSFREALRAGSEVFQVLKEILNEKGLSTAVGDEGGFAPKLKSNIEALELISMAVEKSGYKLGEQIALALDVAATEFFADGFYNWEGKKITPAELGGIYEDWMKRFPMVSIEDGFSEDDWEGWIAFTKKAGEKIQLVGDDLFVTNPKRLQDGISRGAANALLVKVNQIGSLSETWSAVEMAQKANYHTVMSHRSGETEDATIADLSVAFGCQQIKTGSLCRGERTAKYNQLLRIQESLGSGAKYWGSQAFR